MVDASDYRDTFIRNHAGKIRLSSEYSPECADLKLRFHFVIQQRAEKVSVII